MDHERLVDDARMERCRRDESAAIERIRNGDASALGSLYRDLRRPVFAAILRLVRCPSAAEDLTQETFLALPRALLAFRGGCSLRTFVLSTGTNLARHHLRSSHRGQKTLEHYAATPLESSSTSPEQFLATRQLVRAIARALGRLSPDKQRTFLLRAYLEHSAVEIAQLTNTCEVTVRTRVHDAKRLLRRSLLEEGIALAESIRLPPKALDPTHGRS